MDVAPIHQQPTTNDEELARVLAGVDDTPAANSAANGMPGLSFEETPASDAPGAAPSDQKPGEDSSVSPAAPIPTPDPASAPEPETAAGGTVASPVAPATAALATSTPAVPSSGGTLDELKRAALEELRPLVGQLTLPAEEKFDTLLLIIRSTDDQSLLGSAHQAAQQITDETKRAQALLDIIKEIDYFSQPEQAAAA